MTKITAGWLGWGQSAVNERDGRLDAGTSTIERSLARAIGSSRARTLKSALPSSYIKKRVRVRFFFCLHTSILLLRVLDKREKMTAVTNAVPTTVAAPSATKTKKVAAAGGKKKTASKAAPDHPKYSEMISQALVQLKERGGTSRQALLKYIVKNFNVGKDEAAVNSRLKVALRAGVKNATLKQSKGSGAAGSFRLGEAPKKTAAAAAKKTAGAAAKKPKTTAQKATKKAAAGKKPAAVAVKKSSPKKKPAAVVRTKKSGKSPAAQPKSPKKVVKAKKAAAKKPAAAKKVTKKN